MVLSNAERQARYQQRLKERMQECVTPEDVERAIQLIYELQASYFPETDPQPDFETWKASQATKKRGGNWYEMLPNEIDPEAYSDFAQSDATLLLKVAKVAHAMKYPPTPAD